MGKIGPNVPKLGIIGGNDRFVEGPCEILAKFKPPKPVETGKYIVYTCFEVGELLEN